MKSKTLFYLIQLTFITSLTLTAHAQTFSVLHSFTGIGTEGGSPSAGMTIRGNTFYGTTSGGLSGCGTVFQLTHSGSNWPLSTLSLLPYDKGCQPYAGVSFGPDSHLYGTTWNGGKYGQGTVYKLTAPLGPCRTAACYWTVTDLYDFNGPYGSGPLGDLIWDQKGNIYGTTQGGGSFENSGTVYELTPSGSGYTENVIYNFTGDVDGGHPQAGLVPDKQGNLYGTASVVFELTYVPGTGWTEQVIYGFQNPDDGSNPIGGLIFDAVGNLYGTAASGGSAGGGTVFELSPSGNTWTYKVLYSFSGQPSNTCGPYATLSMDAAGNLYGTTLCDGVNSQGNVFKLSNTQNGWLYTSLHDFTGGNDGGGPWSNVSIDTDGTLYGTASTGGDYGQGVVWMIKP